MKRSKSEEDVKAMVSDRRSGRGKANGVPAHLPTPPVGATQVSEDERALVAHALDERRQGEAIIARADAAIEASMRHLLRKYGLAGQDRIDFRTGAITRANGTPANTDAGAPAV